MGTYENRVKWAGETIGELTVGRIIGKAAGNLVQPVVWVAKGEMPDATSVGLYAVGLTNIGFVPALVTALIQATVDDVTLELLKEVHRDEPKCYSRGIHPTVKYSVAAGARINAMTIASRGGTAWQHPNGLWVHFANPKSKELYLYSPNKWREIYSPVLPLKKRNDGYLWTSKKK